MKSNKFTVFGSSVIIAVVLLTAYGFTQMSSSNGTPQKIKKVVTAAKDTQGDHYKVVAPSTPDELEFAGEEVPLHVLDVREKLDRELLVNSYWHSNTFLMMKRANRWFPVIEPILEENGIPEDFKYLALIESGLTNAVSPAGATGFWQFLKETGKEYGLEVNSIVDERYHVEKSTAAACQYLNEAYDRYGSWALVAASYNMGMGGVNKQLNRQGVESYWDLMLNSETSRYVYRIMAVKLICDNPDKYGFILDDETMYEPYETKTVSLTTPVEDLMTYAKDQGINYKALKILNPWMRKDHLVFKTERTYEVTLPVDPSEWTTE